MTATPAIPRMQEGARDDVPRYAEREPIQRRLRLGDDPWVTHRPNTGRTGGVGGDFRRQPVTIPEEPSSTMEAWLLGLDPTAALDGSVRIGVGRAYTSMTELLDDLREHLELQRCRDFAAQWGMSTDEAMACALWSAQCPGIYYDMGRAMREGNDERFAVFAPYASWLKRALSKVPDYEGVVYRAWDTKAHTTSYTTGTEIIFPNFSAAATHLSSEQLHVFGKRQGALLVLDVERGKRISALSFFPNENEVLLPPGWRGFVIGGPR